MGVLYAQYSQQLQKAKLPSGVARIGACSSRILRNTGCPVIKLEQCGRRMSINSLIFPVYQISSNLISRPTRLFLELHYKPSIWEGSSIKYESIKNLPKLHSPCFWSTGPPHWGYAAVVPTPYSKVNPPMPPRPADLIGKNSVSTSRMGWWDMQICRS